MIITNKYNLPAPLVKAAERQKRDPDRLWVTDLVSPPLIRQLILKHFDEIVIDASDAISSMAGTGRHAGLELAGKRLGNCFVEQKWVVEVEGMKVVGITDLVELPSWTLTDYKFTKTWAYTMGGGKSEWEAQVNILDWQWSDFGFEVGSLQVMAVFVDWMRGRAFNKDYPNKNFHIFKFKKWPALKQGDFIREKVLLHQRPAQECAPEEKWQTTKVKDLMGKEVITAGSTYAIQGAKKAKRVLPTREEAEEYLSQQKDPDKYKIIERPAEPKRCLHYCNARSVCPYVKESK